MVPAHDLPRRPPLPTAAFTPKTLQRGEIGASYGFGLCVSRPRRDRESESHPSPLAPASERWAASAVDFRPEAQVFGIFTTTGYAL